MSTQVGRVARYEWTRAVTLRSTWIIAASAVVASAGVAWMLSNAAVTGGFNSPRSAWLAVLSQGATTSMPLISGFAIGLVGVFGWAEDITADGATATLTTLTSRPIVATARFVAVAITAMVIGAACQAAVVGVGLLQLGVHGLSAATIIDQSLRVLGYDTALTLLSGSMCVIFRSASVSIFVLLLAPWLIEPVVVSIVYLTPAFQNHVEMVKYLPFAAMSDVLTSDPAGYIGPPRLELVGAILETLSLAVLAPTVAGAVFVKRSPLRT